MKKVESLHTFTMRSVSAHEDEGTAFSTPASVVGVMEIAKKTFPGCITAHQLARALNVILEPKGFDKDTTLLTTSFDCDEVCRDLEDELRSVYGQNFTMGGIGGFPFGGCTAFGAMGHHIPTNGQVLIVFGPHVGIDFDGVIGKVNRRGHEGSGHCCNTAFAALEYVKAVKGGSGSIIHSPDPSDPMDAQQVFVNSALMNHHERLLDAPNAEVELPHVMFDCQEELFKRIMAKCLPGDVPEGVSIALLGGIQVNTPLGTPEYFLPKTFATFDSAGNKESDLLAALVNEGNKDIKKILQQKRMEDRTAKLKAGLLEVPIEGL